MQAFLDLVAAGRDRHRAELTTHRFPIDEAPAPIAP